MIIIKQPYLKQGYLGDGVLYGYGRAKHDKEHLEYLTFLCVPIDAVVLKPDEYKFYKVRNGKPFQVLQTSRFYTGSRFINPKLYCGCAGWR